ncbi:uncharacterized protein LOC144132372 [Amblyomma americanum]
MIRVPTVFPLKPQKPTQNTSAVQAEQYAGRDEASHTAIDSTTSHGATGGHRNSFRQENDQCALVKIAEQKDIISMLQNEVDSLKAQPKVKKLRFWHMSNAEGENRKFILPLKTQMILVLMRLWLGLGGTDLVYRELKAALISPECFRFYLSFMDVSDGWLGLDQKCSY